MKKKIGIAAIATVLSAAMVCGTLITPVLATNSIAGEIINGNDTSTITKTIPNSLKNGKEIAKVLNYNKAKELLPDLEWGRVMILYTDNTYDIVRLGNEDNCNFSYRDNYVHSGSDNYVTSVHKGYPTYEAGGFMIDIDMPWFGPAYFVEIKELMNYADTDKIDGYIVREVGYKIHVEGSDEGIDTTDPEVVKSYGFVGEQDEWGNYIKWTYNGELASDVRELSTTTPPYKHGETITTGNNNTSSAKGQGWYNVTDNRQVTLWMVENHEMVWWYEGGIIEESGTLNEEPTEPEETEKPTEPEAPIEPVEPDKPVETITITKEHNRSSKESIMLTLRLPSNFDDTEITTPSIDIEKLEAEALV